MNKDFWERIDRLEELAQKLPHCDWEYESWNENIRYNGKRVGVVLPEVGIYIAAANPAMIQEMIATFKGRLSFLEHKLTETDIQLGNAQEQVKRLEKEADWLAEQLVDYGEGWETVEEWRREARVNVEADNA